MKRNFYIGMGLIVILILSLLIYGVYLNERSENQITQKMSEIKLPLRGVKVQWRDIFPVLKPDLIHLYSSEMVDVPTLIDGKINQQFAAANDFVNAGDPIVEIFNEEIPLQIKQAESDILDAQASLTRAQNIYDRYAQLVEMDAVSKLQFDEATANLHSAQAKLDNAIAKRDQLSIRQTRQIITAPISGEVVKFYKQVGAYVSAGTPVVLIVNFDLLRLNLDLDNTFDKISVGQMADIKFPDSQKFEKGYGTKYAAGNLGNRQIFPAKLVEISPPITQLATIRRLTWEIDNKVGLLEPGFYENAEIHLAASKNCLAIPSRAVLDKKSNFVYVDAGGILEQREIISGVTDGEFVEVISGLSEGEVVITSSTDVLTDGLKIAVTLEEAE